jgi:predicted  nucleic acid-binding Zn-ribbon protein
MSNAMKQICERCGTGYLFTSKEGIVHQCSDCGGNLVRWTWNKMFEITNRIHSQGRSNRGLTKLSGGK